MWHLYISNRDSIEKLSSNSEYKSEYLTWDKFQVMATNIGLSFYSSYVYQLLTYHKILYFS